MPSSKSIPKGLQTVNLAGRDFISDLDFSIAETEAVLDMAARLKQEYRSGIPHPILRDKTLAMLFFFTSTRTRGSFEAGMAQLGGHGAFIDSETYVGPSRRRRTPPDYAGPRRRADDRPAAPRR